MGGSKAIPLEETGIDEEGRRPPHPAPLTKTTTLSEGMSGNITGGEGPSLSFQETENTYTSQKNKPPDNCLKNQETPWQKKVREDPILLQIPIAEDRLPLRTWRT